jgi:hypothetical protein
MSFTKRLLQEIASAESKLEAARIILHHKEEIADMEPRARAL